MDGNTGANYSVVKISAFGSVRAVLPGLKTDGTGGDAVSVVAGGNTVSNWGNGRNVAGDSSSQITSRVTPQIGFVA